MLRRQLSRLLSGFVLVSTVYKPATALDSPSDHALEEIVVTAQRRSQSVQDVPLSISALSSAALESSRVDDLDQISSLTPGLNFQTSNRTIPLIYLRGVGTRSFGAGTESSVGVFIDDVYISRVSGAITDLTDVERVEVLKGPQGTLYGRNTVGGAINIITKGPTAQPEGYVEAAGGARDYRDLRAAVSGPVAGDSLTGRLALDVGSQDGWFYNRTTGNDLGGGDTAAIRGKLRWAPSESLTADFAASYIQDSDSGFFGAAKGPDVFLRSPAAPLPMFDATPRSGALSFDPTSSRKISQLSARVLWDLEHTAITSISAYRDSLVREHEDVDETTLSTLHQVSAERSHAISQEFRIAPEHATADGIHWVTGLYLFNDKTARLDDFSTGIDSIFSSLVTAVLDGGPPNPFTPGRVDVDTPLNLNVKTDSVAGFGQADFPLIGHLRGIVGGRYTWERKSAVYDAATSFPGLSVVPVPFTANLEKSWNSFDPKVGLEYQWTPQLMTYLTYTSGFKSGGFQYATTTLDSSSIIFNPEKVKSLESGIRSSWLGGRLIANASIFSYRYTDLQVPKVFVEPNGGASNITINAAKSSIKGGEIEVQASPIDGLTLSVGYAYLDAKFDRYVFIPGAVDYSGNPMTRAPRNTVDLGAQYTINATGGRWAFGTDWYTVSKQYFEADNGATPFSTQDPYSLWNANVSFERGAWRLSAFGRNLGNTTYKTSDQAYPGEVIDTYAPPRTWGASLRWSF
jgi:iron complex outermembrane receptor protein